MMTSNDMRLPLFRFLRKLTQADLRLSNFWVVLLCLFGGNLAFGATTTQITKNGTTWNFSEAVEYGQFVNGDYWVVGPVTVSSVSPGWDGTKNGSMVNPPTDSSVQGYRTGIIYSFSEEVRTAFPVTLDPSAGIQSLVSTIGRTTVISGGSKSGVSKATVLTVVSSAPAEGSFRPPYVAGPKPIRNVSEINYDLVPMLELPSGSALPNLSTTLKEVWLQHGNTRAQPSTTFIPDDNIASYPRDSAVEVSNLALGMMVDSVNRKEYIHRMIQAGIDIYYVHLDNNDAWRAYGGFGSGRKWPILFAGILLNDNDYKSPIYLTPADQSLSGMVNKFGEDGHTSYGQPSALYPQGRPIFGQDCTSGQYANYKNNSSGAKDCRDPAGLNPEGGGGYRSCCTSHTWVGYALAARLMDATSIWGHDAFFDYVDWWVEVDTSGHVSGTFPSNFVGDMWESYRDLQVSSAVVAPVFSLKAGSYSGSQNISITSGTSDATIWYTTDGSEPSEANGTLYTGAISLDTNTTLKAIAYKADLDDSPITTAAYIITGPDTEAPTSPGGLSAFRVTASEIVLTWDAASDNLKVTGYKVYLGNGDPIDVGPARTSTLLALDPSTAYTVSVSAYDAALNESVRSRELPVTTKPMAVPMANFVVDGLRANGDFTSVMMDSTDVTSQTTATPDTLVTGSAGYDKQTMEFDISGLSIDKSGTADDTLTFSVDIEAWGVTASEAGPSLTIDNAFSFSVSTTHFWGNSGLNGGSSSDSSTSVSAGEAVAFAFADANVSIGGEDSGAYKVTFGGFNSVLYDVRAAGLKAIIGRDGTYRLEENPESDHTVDLEGADYAILAASNDSTGRFRLGQLKFGVILESYVADTQAPGIPEGLVASGDSAESVNLSWNWSSDDISVAGYKVYMDQNDGINVGNYNEVSISELNPNTEYSFRVTAYDVEGNESDFSISVSGETESVYTWAGFVRDSDGYINTYSWIGWLDARNAPWMFSYTIEDWIYSTPSQSNDGGAWIYIHR